MTKHTLTACIALLAALTALAPLAAQEVTDTSALTMSDVSLLNTNTYSSIFGFVDGKIKTTSRYVTSAPIEAKIQFAPLSGRELVVDTPLEFALLSYYSPIAIEDATVRTNADSVLPKNNPRIAGKKLGAAVLKELTELKFLDPSNTAATGRYEGVIKFISDRNGVSRAEIENHLRVGIAEIVDEEFSKGVRGGIIPSAVYAQWTRSNVARGADAMQTLKNCIGDFFINPTKENYDRLVIIRACYEENSLKSDKLAYLTIAAYYRTVSSLSNDIYRKIEDISHNNRAALVRAAKSSDELFVFSVRYE